MNISISSIWAGLIFGAFGVHFIRRGKREANYGIIFLGMGLFIYPYFITNNYLLWGLGIVLTVLGLKA